MEALGIGDLHLTDSAGSGGLAKYIEGPDQYVMSEVQRVLDWGIKRGVSNVFLYGDTCQNPRMSYDAMMAFIGCLRKNPDLMFYVILGNHDMYGKVPEAGHSLELINMMKIPNLRIFLKPKTLDIDGTQVRFLPYPHESFNSDALNVFHKEVYGSKGDSGRVSKDEALSKSKAVVVAGHLHTPHRVRNTFYSGTVYQTNFGESLPKGFHHIQFNDASDWEVDQVPFDPRIKLHTVVIQTRRDLVNIPEGKDDLVKLVVQDGADVSSLDFSKRSNIMVTKPFKTKEDLQTVLTEDLAEGTELIIRTEDFFNEWVSSLDVEEGLRKSVIRVRSRVLETMGVKV